MFLICSSKEVSSSDVKFMDGKYYLGSKYPLAIRKFYLKTVSLIFYSSKKIMSSYMSWSDRLESLRKFLIFSGSIGYLLIVCDGL